MTRNILRADPAGNITLFVLDPVPREERAELAARLMALKELGGEQVGFVCPPRGEGAGRMEMMGGEFCGNATRAFGMLLARRLGRSGQVLVETSGCQTPVEVYVDLEAGTARSQMPLPQGVEQVSAAGLEGTLVHLGGIAHLVLEGAEPSLEIFEAAEPLLRAIPGLDAYGVIFLGEGGTMTPLVKVPATGTLVWEGSCGSGSLASAVAQSQGMEEGTLSRAYIQPAGVILVQVTRRGGEVVQAHIGGTVILGDPISVEL